MSAITTNLFIWGNDNPKLNPYITKMYSNRRLISETVDRITSLAMGIILTAIGAFVAYAAMMPVLLGAYSVVLT